MNDWAEKAAKRLTRYSNLTTFEISDIIRSHAPDCGELVEAVKEIMIRPPETVYDGISGDKRYCRECVAVRHTLRAALAKWEELCQK